MISNEVIKNTNRYIRIQELRSLNELLDIHYEKHLEHYASRPGTVSNTNVILRLLTMYSPCSYNDLDELIEHVWANHENGLNALGINGLTTRGNVQRINHFYGKPWKEVITITANKRQVERQLNRLDDTLENVLMYPIRVLYHTSDDVRALELTGKHAMSGEGYAVLEVDAIKLAVTYRIWAERNHSESRIANYHDFLAQYVMPRLSRSHIRVAYFNKLMINLLNDSHFTQSSFKAQYYYPDYDGRLNMVVTKVVNELRKWTQPIPDLMGAIPIPFGSNTSLINVPVAPNLPINNAQCEWIHLLVSQPYLRFALFLSKLHSRNDILVYDVRRWVSRVTNNRYLQSGHSLPARDLNLTVFDRLFESLW